MSLMLAFLSVIALAGPAQNSATKKISLQPEFKPQETFAQPVETSTSEAFAPVDKNAKPAEYKKSGMKVSTGCRSSSGHEYKAGDVGYETCLSNLQMKTPDSKKDDAGATVNFKFGE